MTTRSGKVEGDAGKSQHVDAFRKILLRRELLGHAGEGAAYVPFIGEGDLAAELYTDRPIYGADLDPERVATAAARLPGSEVIVADCDRWPFADLAVPFALADLDSYSNPYLALVAFWTHATRVDGPVVIFGTDGQRQTIFRQHKTIELPSCKGTPTDKLTSRTWGNRWWPEHVLPFIRETVAPWTVTREVKYGRGPSMIYWGVVVEPPPSGSGGWTKPGEQKRQTSAHYRDQVRKRVARRRAKLPDLTPSERLAALVAGDWTCWLCGQPIDPQLEHPDPMSASVDHVVAAYQGGTNDPENLRPAHLGCNGRKRDKPTISLGDEVPAPPPVEDEAAARYRAVGDALYEAAKSGNVPAILAWLERRDREADRGAAPGTGGGSDADLGFAPDQYPTATALVALTDAELDDMARQLMAEKQRRLTP